MPEVIGTMVIIETEEEEVDGTLGNLIVDVGMEIDHILESESHSYYYIHVHIVSLETLVDIIVRIS